MTGLATLGAAVGGAIFSGGIVAGTLASYAIGAVTSALVGATIGGLTAAVTGGDIGSGMLIGAIGGVITGGIAGGAIVDSFAGSASQLVPETTTATIGGTSYSTGGLAMFEGELVNTATVSQAGTSSSLFGGAVQVGSLGLSDKLMDFAIAGLSGGEDGETPYGQSQEYLDKKLEAEKEIAMANVNKGFAPLPWSSSKEAGIMQGEQAKEQIALKNEAAMAQLKEQGVQNQAQLREEYSLSGQQAAEAYERETAKFGESAKARAGATFQGADEATNAAIIARQEEEQGMLNGY